MRKQQEWLNVPQLPPATLLLPAHGGGRHHHTAARRSGVRGLRINLWGQPFGTWLPPITPAGLMGANKKDNGVPPAPQTCCRAGQEGAKAGCRGGIS